VNTVSTGDIGLRVSGDNDAGTIFVHSQLRILNGEMNIPNLSTLCLILRPLRMIKHVTEHKASSPLLSRCARHSGTRLWAERAQGCLGDCSQRGGPGAAWNTLGRPSPTSSLYP